MAKKKKTTKTTKSKPKKKQPNKEQQQQEATNRFREKTLSMTQQQQPPAAESTGTPSALSLIEPTSARPIHDSGTTVEGGTAHIQPQFELLRHGHRFLTAQDFKGLHKALYQAEEMEEQIVEIDFTMDGYPLDCIVQVNRAIWAAYGFSHARERQTFFGPIPPKRINIKTSLTESVQVVYGEMAPPAWEGGSLNMHVDMSNPLSLSITGEIKRKFEPAIKEIVQLAEKFLKEQSIYRGNAVELDLNYIVTGNFDPTHCAPTFIPVTSPVDLILSQGIERQLDTHLWNVIRNPQHFRPNGVPIKTGMLLDGEPGTGKTLTAYRTAQVTVESKMTYLYLRTPITAKTFLTGYKMAQLYGPSVYFVEDCDMLFGKDRDDEMNSLLETLDGITAKNAEVITIFTTNYPERLNRAFTRSGRINQKITLRAPDSEAAARFVRLILGRHLDKDIDLKAVGEKFANLVQSDIKNGCDIAKKYRIGKVGEDIEGQVTTEDLMLAAEEVWEKVRSNTAEEDPRDKKLRTIKEGVGAMFGGVAELAGDVEIVRSKVEDTDKIARKIAQKVGA